MHHTSSTYSDPAARQTELRLAVDDPMESEAVRTACIGLQQHMLMFERFLDRAVIPNGAPGIYTEIMNPVDAAENAAVLALRRHRAGAGSKAEVIRAFADLRRAIVAAMSKHSNLEKRDPPQVSSEIDPAPLSRELGALRGVGLWARLSKCSDEELESIASLKPELADLTNDELETIVALDGEVDEHELQGFISRCIRKERTEA